VLLSAWIDPDFLKYGISGAGGSRETIIATESTNGFNRRKESNIRRNLSQVIDKP
jgi:hypothetical protein